MRVWTVEELDLVHPLPDGWSWKYECDSWWAVLGDEDDAERASCFIWTDDRDRFGSAAGTLGCHDAPADVALAVILASKGLDSMDAMARATVFESVRAAIDRQSKKAKAEVARLTAMVKFNATGLTEEDKSIGIPACYAWRITEEQIALQAAHAQLAAVRQVWLAVSCEVDDGANGKVKA
jgi:hypothetical protein